MADISGKITRKSMKAKKNAAIKTIKTQAKEKIKQVKIEYAQNPERKMVKENEKNRRREERIQKANARLAYSQRQVRQYTLKQDILNSLINGIGAALAVSALVLLIIRSTYYDAGIQPKGAVITAFTLFGSSLVAGFLFSTLEHAISGYYPRKVFSVLTYCGMYFVLAATYAAFVIPNVAGNVAWVICIVVWSLCILFAVLYCVLGAKFKSFVYISLVVMGWLLCGTLGLFAVPMGMVSKVFFFVGGACYTVGALFVLMNSAKWTHSLVHAFILAGAIMHFFSVLYLI